MRIGALLCVFAGHRWAPWGDDAHEGMVVLRCRRCARETTRSAETFEAEPWTERWARQKLADEPWYDVRSFDPRIVERRRPDRPDD